MAESVGGLSLFLIQVARVPSTLESFEVTNGRVEPATILDAIPQDSMSLLSICKSLLQSDMADRFSAMLVLAFESRVV